MKTPKKSSAVVQQSGSGRCPSGHKQDDKVASDGVSDPNRRKPSPGALFAAPQIPLSFWLALSSASVAFAIVSEQLLFALFIGVAALPIHALSPQTSKKIHYSARFLFTLVAYLAALLPLWPEALSAYYFAPLLLVLGVALLAAFNQHSYGGSRAVTSITTVAFLLFLRNIVLSFEFEAPIAELAYSIAFISFIEIALSKHFSKNDAHPHPELVCGMVLALAASFQFTSLPLGILLAALPLLAFLLRNHELAQTANEHTRPATPLSPSRRPLSLHPSLFTLPLLLAALFYLITLRLPYWADHLPKNAPYIAQAMARKADTISNAAKLEDEAVEALAHSIVDQEFLKEKASQLAQSWNQEPKPPKQPDRSSDQERLTASETAAQAPETIRPYDPDNYDYSFGPFARNRANANQTPSPATADNIEVAPQYPNATAWNSGNQQSPSPDLTPPTSSLKPGIPDGLDLAFGEPSELAAPPPDSQLPSLNAQLPSEAPAPPDFDRFLDSFEQPEQAISQALNLEGNDVSALLSEEALVTVKLDSSRAAPRRLYLRSNVLDTVNRSGLGGTRGEEGRVEIPTPSGQIVALETFRQSRSQGTPLTITSNQSRNPTLPLPESFAGIQVFGVPTLDVYPEERVALAPLSNEPISYRLYEADLEVTERERSSPAPSTAYREQMLDIPLSNEDRKYLEKLAKRVGGSRSPSRQFAYRFSNYFSNRHPYSYFVTIPPGPGHAVVRWLENERPGLCSNYAAAFTLLARSRGIPARVVSGFASNEYDPKEGRYILRQRNAHAWVEYLDEANQWTRFDPTPKISEAEIIRAEQYVTAARPQSLQRLLAAAAKIEANPTETERTQPPSKTDSSRSPSPVELETAAKAEDASNEATKPAEAPIPNSNAAQSEAPEPPASIAKSNPAQEPKPNTVPTEPSAPSLTVDRTSTAAPSNAPEEITPEKNPPWLLLLVVLAVLIPGIAYLLRIQKPRSASPELQLRHKAGRLLAQLDSLLQLHELEDDPIWTETRQSLSQQRYGRDANPILVQDLAVKIALLSKRKKQT